MVNILKFFTGKFREQKMRKVVYSIMVSLDGYIESSNRGLNWVIIDEELHQYINDQLQEIGAYLYGRRSMN
jgi:hypothetical protein